MNDAPTMTRERGWLETAEAYIKEDFFGDKRDIDPGFENFTPPRRELWFALRAAEKEHSDDFIAAGDLRAMEAIAFLKDGVPWNKRKTDNTQAVLRYADEDYANGLKILKEDKSTSTEKLIEISARIAQRTKHIDAMGLRVALESMRYGGRSGCL